MAQPKLPPVLASTIGKTVYVEGKPIWKVVDEIRRNENGYDEKILLLQKLRLISDDKKELLRFGYYIIGKKSTWVWGRFAPFITSADFKKIIQEAITRKWIKI